MIVFCVCFKEFQWFVEIFCCWVLFVSSVVGFCLCANVLKECLQMSLVLLLISKVFYVTSSVVFVFIMGFGEVLVFGRICLVSCQGFNGFECSL